MRKPLFILGMIALMGTGCDDDTALAPFTPVLFLEDFQEAEDGQVLDIDGWGNFAEGNVAWHEEKYSGNGYAALENTNDTPIIAWLVSPPVNIDSAEFMAFQSAQHHLSQTGNSLEALISTNYNGDVATADWQSLEAVTADYSNQWYAFVPSGSISLAGYSGTVHFAFKATLTESGSAYFIDNVKVY